MEEIGDQDGWNILLLPADGGAPVPYLATPFNEQSGIVSPDGKWLLYMSDESGSPQSYVQSFPEPGHKQQVSKSGSYFALWNRNGREIFLIRTDGSVASVAVEPGPELRFGEPKPMFAAIPGAGGWDVAADGQRFLMAIPAERTVPGISVAVNWRTGRE
jgi:hypothetical protein